MKCWITRRDWSYRTKAAGSPIIQQEIPKESWWRSNIDGVSRSQRLHTRPIIAMNLQVKKCGLKDILCVSHTASIVRWVLLVFTLFCFVFLFLIFFGGRRLQGCRVGVEGWEDEWNGCVIWNSQKIQRKKENKTKRMNLWLLITHLSILLTSFASFLILQCT